MNWRRFLLPLVAVIVLSCEVRSADAPVADAPDAIISHIRREPVASSGIATVGYSKRLRALEIEFWNGGIYRYLDVPPSLYRDLLAAESKARFYNQNIRHKFKSLHVRPRRE
jgi:hypothetical protein